MSKNHDIIVNYIQNAITTTPNIIDNNLKTDEVFNKRTELDYILKYLDEFLEKGSNNRFLLLPGLRGVGKTVLLYQVYEYLFKNKNIPLNNILYLSLDKLNSITEFSLFEIVETYLDMYHNTSISLLDKKIILLIDEAQYSKDWALQGKIIYDTTKNIFMVFTGFSALELEYNADAARRLLKHNISTLNYSEYVNLKYNCKLRNISDAIKELLFTGDVNTVQNLEHDIITSLVNIPEYENIDWNEYLKFGGFPSNFNLTGIEATNNIIDIIDKVINIDFNLIKDVNSNTKVLASRLLYLLALQKPGNLSQNKIANYLDCSVSLVKTITELLEKTELIFHIEAYGSNTKRNRASWKYYFTSSSLRHSLALNQGINFKDATAYEGILLENLVASSLHNLRNKGDLYFNTYYDVEKNHADFLIQRSFTNPIPIEVGKGKKKKKEVYASMKKYGSDYGILVSDRTFKTEKEDDIILIPYKTFSFL